MHCGVMVTGYNQGDGERLLAEDYGRPPAVSDAANMDDTLYLGELVEPLGFDSIWATEHYGSAYSMQPNPLQYLAYWAGRTRRVDVGTAVIVARGGTPCGSRARSRCSTFCSKAVASTWASGAASLLTSTRRSGTRSENRTRTSTT